MFPPPVLSGRAASLPPVLIGHVSSLARRSARIARPNPWRASVRRRLLRRLTAAGGSSNGSNDPQLARENEHVAHLAPRVRAGPAPRWGLGYREKDAFNTTDKQPMHDIGRSERGVQGNTTP